MKRFVLLFMFLYPTLLRTDVIDNLAQALQHISVRQESQKKDASVVNGQWLLKAHRKKLVAFDENYENRGIKLYQIKVQEQEADDCWIHALRNGLYIMDMLASPRKDFDAIYRGMTQRGDYKAFTQYGCPIDGNAAFKLIKQQLDCRPLCIPQNSPTYVDRIVRFEYKKKFKQNPADTKAFDVALLSYNDLSATLKRFGGFIRAMHASTDYVFCIALDIVATDHAVALVVHKFDNKIEYFFADSNNCSFKHGYNQYCKNDGPEFREAISGMIRLIENPGYFESLAKTVNR